MRVLPAIFEKVAETQLVQPTFIYDYPAELSPVSKPKPGYPKTVKRFELYIAEVSAQTLNGNEQF